MLQPASHITVCVCTFRRPEFLRRLWDGLRCQHTAGLFSFSLAVVDNDSVASAQEAVRAMRQDSILEVQYLLEPEQNIALARNRALAHAHGDFLAFIDDDEFPPPDWLLSLFRAVHQFQADAVLGPVLPHFDQQPPAWILRGRFFERPRHLTGTVLPWTNTRTGNILLHRSVFQDSRFRFNPDFGSGGEDRELFRRMIAAGCRFVWCDEAPVFEAVPPGRCRRTFLLRRALLRGKTPYNHSFSAHLKSVIAIPAYSLLLPLLALTRHHWFMKYLVSYCDHLGRILAAMGLQVVKDKYISE